MRWCRLIDPSAGCSGWRLMISVRGAYRWSRSVFRSLGWALSRLCCAARWRSLCNCSIRTGMRSHVISARGLSRHHQMLTALPVAMALLLQASDNSAILVFAICKLL